MGTPEAMYDQSGEKTWECKLNSYGKVRNFKGDKKSDCPFRYQGQYEDAETGLYYNRFRYYSPDEGMYISQDPARLYGGDNLYGYVTDVNIYIDPFGLWSKKKRPPHNATATLSDDSGNEKYSMSSTSGNMTSEEKALGFPQNSLATHAEARITKDENIRRQATSGDTLVIQGEYSPCPSCKGKMNNFKDETGADVIYKWTDEDGVDQEWEATGKKGCNNSQQ